MRALGERDMLQPPILGSTAKGRRTMPTLDVRFQGPLPVRGGNGRMPSIRETEEEIPEQNPAVAAALAATNGECCPSFALFARFAASIHWHGGRN